jgi:hypothetical protein
VVVQPVIVDEADNVTRELDLDVEIQFPFPHLKEKLRISNPLSRKVSAYISRA